MFCSVSLYSKGFACVNITMDIGSTDFWADPEGEHRSAFLASEVYQLYGNPARAEAFPAVNTPVLVGKIGYHLRQGPIC